MILGSGRGPREAPNEGKIELRTLTAGKSIENRSGRGPRELQERKKKCLEGSQGEKKDVPEGSESILADLIARFHGQYEKV